MTRVCAALAWLVLLTGCRDQSALHPSGIGAAQIAHLGWLLFALAAAILLIVVAAAFIAIRGSPRLRGWLAGERAIVAGGVILPAVVLSALLAYGIWSMRPGIAEPDRDPALQIHVTGEQWWWRVSYRDSGGGQIASANEIRIPSRRGRRLHVVVGRCHPQLLDPEPRRQGRHDPGPHNAASTARGARRASSAVNVRNIAAGAHALMALNVIAMPPDGFRSLAGRASPPRPPSPPTNPARRGKALFLAAGCGACHTVRGSDAAGTIGPDLTHVGARR